MEFKFRKVVLRDMGEADIEDEIRWNTVETQWAQWDAPWESLEALKSFDPAAHRRTELEQLKKPKPEIRNTLELDTEDGVHIGSVASYFVDQDFNWISKTQPGQTRFRALGLDISESRYWGKGLGTQALTAWILYFGEHGERELYLQTWSGNTRMIRCAMKLGFQEVCRKPGIRQVRGETWDGLTFCLNMCAFQRYLLVGNLKDLALTSTAQEAVLGAYDARPGFYEAAALTSYEGEGPEFPICRKRPLDRLVLWCCHMTWARRQYEARGVSHQVILDTCSDIALRAKLYEAKTGKPGLSKDDVIWFRHIHHASIFRLGPLQFQRFEMVYLDEEGCGQAYMTFASEQKAHLPQGTPVINLHIPKDANLSPATVADALDQAMAFFPQVFPEHRAKAFLCYSWLLYPGLQALLPKESNILQFAARFQIIGQARDPAESIRRIYGKRFPRKENYPQDTQLQRQALGRFSFLGEACGILEIPASQAPQVAQSSQT